MRVFLGPVEIAGHYSKLAVGFEQIGVDACFLSFSKHRFRYVNFSSRPRELLPTIVDFLVNLQSQAQSRFFKLILRGIVLLMRPLVFVWAAIRFDVFFFGFGRTILPAPLMRLELFILARLGRSIIFRFHGSDCRPPYLNGFSSRRDQISSRRIKEVKMRISLIEEYATIIINSPFQAQFLERPFVKSSYIGLPQIEGPTCSPPHVPSEHGVRILHSPSNPVAKGTVVIEEVVRSLQAKGHRIDFVQVRGVSNDRVLEELRACDFVVDQVYSDTPMAGFAAEAALCGKAAVVAGYAATAWESVSGGNENPPVEFCAPENLEKAIEKLATDEGYRRRLGADAKTFVLTQWSAAAVAKRLECLLKSGPPRDWIFDPNEIRYVWGAGASKQVIRQNLKQLIREHGEDIFQLRDKPHLLQEIRNILRES